ncbi:hypothetical protein KKC88_02120 [Patescibacteria group bacterium]|nr:hypothetical protein [Patescibacteria group bacterium]MBU1673514.1 hypothetical protein [Patescibacteria group bacterium]MBU1963740.1 hypothetical protein [Patescibacteria group bacterium]
MKIKLLLLIVPFFLLAMGASCSQNEITKNEKQSVSNQCISLCQDALNTGHDLSQSPCLGDPMESEPDWVCDVAHSPRTDVDDIAENQCSSYRSREASHFVEVTPECKFLTSN